MSAAIPQRDPAADPGDFGADLASPSEQAAATTDLGGEPSGEPPRAKNTREENGLAAIQSRYDKLKNLVGNKLSGRWLQELGGDGIDTALHQFETLLKDPQVAQAAKRLARNPDGTWGLSAAQRAAAAVDAGLSDPSSSDEFVDPWDKAIEARLKPLEERLNALIEGHEEIAQSNAGDAVARHTRQFLTEYPLSQEERAEFSEKIGPAIQRLNPRTLTKMTYEQFKKFIGLPEAEPYLGNVFARKATQKRSQLSELATDATGAPSLGAETRPNAPVRPKNIQELGRITAAAAMRAAREAGSP
jgi:hypothetical protein